MGGKWNGFIFAFVMLLSACASRVDRQTNPSTINKIASKADSKSEMTTSDSTTSDLKPNSTILKPLPPLQAARVRNVDIKHLALDVQFDWLKQAVFGQAAITLSPLHASNKINLDAGNLVINSIRLPNYKALEFSYDGRDRDDGLTITLDRIYQSQENLTLEINYRSTWINKTDPNNLSGSYGKGVRFLQPGSSDLSRPREIWSMGEPQSNRYWFPGYDGPDDYRTTHITATIENGFSVIANGRLASTRKNRNGTSSFVWVSDKPYANHLTGIVVGKYVDIKQKTGSVNLHNYAYLNEIQATKDSVVRLPDMVNYFSQVTATPYPFENYSQVFIQDVPGWISNTGFSAITENMVDDDRTHAEFFYLWDLTEAEALAQQWFGSYVTANDWSEAWLDKSFARYYNGLYNQYKNGNDEFQIYQRLFDQGIYLSDWNSGVRRPLVTRHYDDVSTMVSDNYAYSRGALTLHMLRKQLGETKWRAAIAHYLKTNAHRGVSTTDFIASVDFAAGESMAWFFEQWVYSMGHPIFAASKEYDPSSKKLRLRLQQTQVADSSTAYPQAQFFAGRMDIEIDDRIETIELKARADQSFEFSATTEPKLVNIDFESTWIKEIKYERSLDDLLYLLRHSRDITAKRGALDSLAVLAKKESTSKPDQERIHSALRETILSDSWWRYRTAALTILQSIVAPVVENKTVVLDREMRSMLLEVIKKDRAWLRMNAIRILGLTGDPEYVDLYLFHLNDESDRVINAAAVALGKTKDTRAFAALKNLVNKPSWKNQSLMSALAGLKELGDARGFDIAFKALADPNLLRWRLPQFSVWDYRVIAVDTIVALGQAEKAYPLLLSRLKQSMQENDLNSVFNNALLLANLADPRAQEAFDLLKAKYKEDANSMSAVTQFETQFKEAII